MHSISVFAQPRSTEVWCGEHFGRSKTFLWRFDENPISVKYVTQHCRFRASLVCRRGFGSDGVVPLLRVLDENFRRETSNGRYTTGPRRGACCCLPTQTFRSANDRAGMRYYAMKLWWTCRLGVSSLSLHERTSPRFLALCANFWWFNTYQYIRLIWNINAWENAVDCEMQSFEYRECSILLSNHSELFLYSLRCIPLTASVICGAVSIWCQCCGSQKSGYLVAHGSVGVSAPITGPAFLSSILNIRRDTGNGRYTTVYRPCEACMILLACKPISQLFFNREIWSFRSQALCAICWSADR